MERKGLRYAYVNMKTAQSKFLVYRSLVDCIEPDLVKSRSMSPEEVLRMFLKELRKRRLRACQIYYKSGSRRYPGHSIPLEIIPAVEEALKEWKQRRLR